MRYEATYRGELFDEEWGIVDDFAPVVQTFISTGMDRETAERRASEWNRRQGYAEYFDNVGY